MNRARTAVCIWAIAVGIVAAACGGDSDSSGANADNGSPEAGTTDASEGTEAAAPDAHALTDGSAGQDAPDALEAQDAQDATLDRGSPSLFDATVDADAVAPGVEVEAADADSGASDGESDADVSPESSIVDAGPDAMDCDASTNDADSADAAESGADDADSDLPPDDAEAGPLGSTEQVLVDAAGADCLACAQDAGCLGVTSTCDDFTGEVEAGPSNGGLGQSLCLDALRCELRTFCYVQGGSEFCICDNLNIPSCTESGMAAAGTDGNCTTQEANALESTDTNVEIAREHDPSYPGGLANNLAICLLNNECLSCLGL